MVFEAFQWRKNKGLITNSSFCETSFGSKLGFLVDDFHRTERHFCAFLGGLTRSLGGLIGHIFHMFLLCGFDYVWLANWAKLARLQRTRNVKLIFWSEQISQFAFAQYDHISSARHATKSRGKLWFQEQYRNRSLSTQSVMICYDKPRDSGTSSDKGM